MKKKRLLGVKALYYSALEGWDGSSRDAELDRLAWLYRDAWYDYYFPDAEKWWINKRNK